MTTTRTRTRQALLALAGLAAFALLAPVFPDARIRVATGAVEIGRGEPPSWKPAGEGDALGAGDRVRTGEDGRAEIAQGGATLRLYPNSMLRLPDAAAGAAAVELERGTSLFDVLRRGEGEPLEVRTPEVVVSVKGTRFGVAQGDDAASVSVFRGLVGVRDAELEAAPETLVQAGYAAFGSDHFELSWHGADDPWESWSRGGAEPDSLERRAPRRDAALRDAHEATLKLARELPQRPARGGDERKPRPDPAELAPPAARDELKAGEPLVGSVRDVVADADGALEETLEESYVEKLLNDGSTDGSGGALPLLTIDYLDGSGSSGPDVVVLGDGTNTWSFEEDEVEAIYEGTLALPSDLETLVQARGWSDAELANQLLPLFD